MSSSGRGRVGSGEASSQQNPLTRVSDPKAILPQLDSSISDPRGSLNNELEINVANRLGSHGWKWLTSLPMNAPKMPPLCLRLHKVCTLVTFPCRGHRFWYNFAHHCSHKDKARALGLQSPMHGPKAIPSYSFTVPLPTDAHISPRASGSRGGSCIWSSKCRVLSPPPLLLS